MIVLRWILLNILLGINAVGGLAQVVQRKDLTLTTTNGLPNATITGLVQDRTGFIWIATADGLARYNGRQMKVFRHDEQSNSLAENTLSRLQLLTDGSLLLQTLTGDFQQFDPVSERFLLVLPLSKQGKRKVDDGWMAPDGQSFWALWRGEQIQCFDRTFRLKYTWNVRNLGLTVTKTLHTIVPASNGRVYAHFDDGLVELQPKTGQHRLLPFPALGQRQSRRSMPVKDWKLLAERPTGEILVIREGELLLFNPKKGSYRTLSMPGSTHTGKGMYAMRVLADGKVYIGVANQLYELQSDDQFALLYEWEASPGEHKSYGIPYLYDRSGALWLHTQLGDLVRIDRQAYPFQHYRYRTDWKSDLLQLGLGVKPPSWNESSGDSWTRFTYAQHNLWFIDLASLYRCDPSKHWVNWASSHHTGDQCACKIAVKPDQQEHLWVYGNEEGGLTEMDTSGRVKRIWPTSLVPQPLENRGLDVADIQPMGNSVWLASYQGKGLYQYSLKQKKIVAQWQHSRAVPQSLPTNHLLCLAADPRQPAVLWIGTLDGGLTRFDTQIGQFHTFTRQDGLPSHTIQSLLSDPSGFLWIGTDKGLVRMDTRTFQMRWFTSADGLQDDEFGYALATRLPDNRLAFGGQTGITLFDPATLKEDTFEPPIVLSALWINNTPVDVGQPNSPLSKSLNALDELVLSYTQNFLTFEFAGLQYSKPDKIQYRYRLSGVDPDWVNAGLQNTANYTQLQPGHYTFEVMATNTNGQWSRHTKRLTILITPPFWATGWAYALYSLLIGGGLIGFVQFRIRQGRQAQEMELQRREAEQLKAVDELKTRFFSNITHEFRTPLSLILSPTEKLLQEEKHDSSTRQTLTSIHRNAGQLLLLINQLLDLSKLEAGSMRVNLVRGNVIQFIGQLVESFRPVADHKGIVFSVRLVSLEEEHDFDADKWATILTNILSNAIKFTPPGGEVTVELATLNPDSISITISDTGIGIPAEKLPHIFDRFYQVDDTRTRAYEGTGIGLALVNELITILGGTIQVESQPNKGTTFIVQLPIQPAINSPAELMDRAVVPTGQLITYVPDRSVVDSSNRLATFPLVLIVEDNRELLQFMADELAKSYRILTAVNGEEGWQLAQAELPDLVISDIMMPGMDGYELTHRLKTCGLTNHIAVMLLTARASHASRMEGLEQGADEYLTKPFHIDELHQRLHNLLTRQQTLRDYYYQEFSRPDKAESVGRFQPETMADEFMRQLHAAIDEHLADSTFGVEELARQLGMSRRTLHRKLAVVVSQSATDIIRQHRLKRAAQFLLAGYNVSETTYLVGYESPSHFSLIFREFFQKTPTEYTQM